MVEHRCVYVVLMYITRYVRVIVIYIPIFAICTPTGCEIYKHRYVLYRCYVYTTLFYIMVMDIPTLFSDIFLHICFCFPHECEMVEHRCVYVVLMYITRYVHVIVLYIPTFAICTPPGCEIIKRRYVYVVVMYIQRFFI